MLLNNNYYFYFYFLMTLKPRFVNVLSFFIIDYKIPKGIIITFPIFLLLSARRHYYYNRSHYYYNRRHYYYTC
jgi:hypothetical protein